MNNDRLIESDNILVANVKMLSIEISNEFYEKLREIFGDESRQKIVRKMVFKDGEKPEVEYWPMLFECELVSSNAMRLVTVSQQLSLSCAESVKTLFEKCYFALLGESEPKKNVDLYHKEEGGEESLVSWEDHSTVSMRFKSGESVVKLMLKEKTSEDDENKAGKDNGRVERPAVVRQKGTSYKFRSIATRPPPMLSGRNPSEEMFKKWSKESKQWDVAPSYSSSAYVGGYWKVEEGVVGLHNLGNTCYLNAGLQCILHCRAVVQHFNDTVKGEQAMREGLKASSILHKLMEEMMAPTVGTIYPRDVTAALQATGQFKAGEQHDAAEAVCVVLDMVNEELKSSKDLDNVIADNFCGEMRSVLQCPECGSKSEKLEPFYSLALEVPLPRPYTVKTVVCGLDLRLSLFFLPVHFRTTTQQLLEQLSTSLQRRPSELLLYVLTQRHELAALGPRDFCFEELRGKTLMCYDVSGPEPSFVYATVEIAHLKVESVMGVPLVQRVSAQGHASLLATVQSLVERQCADWFGTEDVPMEEEDSSGDVSSSLPFVDLTRPRQTESCCSLWYCKGGAWCLVTPDVGIEPYARYRVRVLWEQPFVKLFDQDRVVCKRRAEEVAVEPNEDEEGGSLATIQDCVRRFLRGEKLGSSDLWNCKHCRQKTAANKSMELSRLPNVLILQLKRFEFERHSKIDTFVSFPFDEELRLGEMVAEGRESDNVFELLGVVKHSGTLAQGHYTANVRWRGGWYDFNDATVKPIVSGAEHVHSSSVYLLFHQRKPCALDAPSLPKKARQND